MEKLTQERVQKMVEELTDITTDYQIKACVNEVDDAEKHRNNLRRQSRKFLDITKFLNYCDFINDRQFETIKDIYYSHRNNLYTSDEERELVMLYTEAIESEYKPVHFGLYNDELYYSEVNIWEFTKKPTAQYIGCDMLGVVLDLYSYIEEF